MNNYRSAYENYYKNINNEAKGKKGNNKYPPIGSHDNVLKFSHGVSRQGEFNIKELCIKRITRELIGSTILLLMFVGLKYIPINQVKEFHTTCRQVLNQQFNYDESIDAFNNIQIGDFKTKDLGIENLKSENFNISNLKVKASNFIQYLKSNSNLQVKPENE